MPTYQQGSKMAGKRGVRGGAPQSVGDLLLRISILEFDETSERHPSCPKTGCWAIDIKPAKNGYCQVRVSGERGPVHRFVYEYFVGAVPEGNDLDHLCRNRSCCNFEHLESVSRQVNLLRGKTVTARNAAATHCPQGHPYSGDNLYLWTKKGHRFCKVCQRANQLRQRARRRALRQQD